MLPRLNPAKTTMYQENKMLRNVVRELTEKDLHKEAMLAELIVKNIHEEIEKVTNNEVS